ncbi:16S rRNA (cytosine(967)-C(5))-methyltransferase RsmB [Psychrobium sp. 1_MG-2023]|uniref:16S rRNA (cytosine(967)-C(5))-methyltransferase RsmB n=1 Tax=Psychrobium sp. 1_MG-2023 TaxID=3062624 RepID=UPI000C33A3C6|nr:16S rRNA (cytosine(967)-C(5))-methyltransferase RsmB [Psychrobium sp. 1_MG-2023]MDP2560399.1 16S rRNA (cytosine(967)-C(5))-methyltransferase RsmB [Psychrobium sp. 1_MG-2023]PKF57932.1 16S rRNA (cytosine(967)-C(5))-methyltransferase [Alteromonadales bacterium alter-6D02]
MNLRAVTAQIIGAVLDKGESLATALPAAQGRLTNPKDKALLQELCYGIMRELPQLEFYINRLMDKPMTGKQRVIHYLLLVGAYQLLHTRIPAHAALGETVEATKDLKRPKLKGLINGVLRNLQRQHESLSQEMPTKAPIAYCHPSWFIKRVSQAYPKQWQQILEANNQRSPMWLRNNASMQTRDDYLAQLAELEIEAHAGVLGDNSIKLVKPSPVGKLPQFDQGACSVQDGAAQRAAEILGAQPGELVLDACAAPGGKTCHILESAQGVEVVALDCDQQRLERVQQNLDRIGLNAQLICGDGTQPQEWWQGAQFDRILLDAPCSATGVIRRNPDIKWLRRDSDIAQLVELQKQILEACWSLLKSGGTLVYATCSVLPDENSEQIKQFLQQHTDASLQPLHQDDTPQQPGLQLLPGQDDVDGFYYAKLTKA